MNGLEFEELGKSKQESIVMIEILKALNNLGGQATTKKIKQYLALNSDEIPEEYMDFIKTSRNNNEYAPFDYTYNFSVTNLLFAGFLERPRPGFVELTEKGRSTNPSFINVKKDILRLSAPEWEKRKNNKNKVEKVVEDVAEVAGEHAVNGWKEQLLMKINKFSPSKFEMFARRLVDKMGVDIDPSKGIVLSGDGGIDGFGYLTSDDFRTSRVAIQAKKWNVNSKVSSPEIDKFRGAMDKLNAEFGIFITTADFTKDAVQASREGTRVITLINGEKITELVAKYEINVTPKITYVLDDFYDNPD